MSGRAYNPIYRGRTEAMIVALYDSMEAESVRYHIEVGQPAFDEQAAELMPLVDDLLETITENAENAELHYSGMGA